jgi:hypothetical protein
VPTDTQKAKITEEFKEELDFDVATEEKCRMMSGRESDIMEELAGLKELVKGLERQGTRGEMQSEKQMT